MTELFLKNKIPAEPEVVTRHLANKPGIFQRTFAIVLITLCFYLIWDFPLNTQLLMISLSIYLVLLFIFPYIWLLVVPAILPVIDFAFWSDLTINVSPARSTCFISGIFFIRSFLSSNGTSSFG